MEPIPYIINNYATHSDFDYFQCFSSEPYSDINSPYYNYTLKCGELAIISAQFSEAPAGMLQFRYSLLVLGYFSAVENYIRELLTRIVMIDTESQDACKSTPVKFGAAFSHIKYDGKYLPEALLEDSSFTSRDNIFNAFNKFTGIKLTDTCTKILARYERVSHIRHCVIHRHGRFGSDSIINTSFTEHKDFLEKVITINQDILDQISRICTSVVDVINQELFRKILSRRFSNRKQWQFNFDDDKKLLIEYYNVFRIDRKKPRISELRKIHKQLLTRAKKN